MRTPRRLVAASLAVAALLGLALLAPPVAPPATTQTLSVEPTGTIDANGESAGFNTGAIAAGRPAGWNSVTVQVTGTFVGTLAFQGTGNGSTYTAIRAMPVTGKVPVTATTTTGIWTIPTGGLQRVQVIATAWTSGAAVVYIRPSDAVAQAAGMVEIPDTYETGTMDAEDEEVVMELRNVGIPIVVFGLSSTCANAGTLVVFEYDGGDGEWRTAQAMQFSNPSLDAGVTNDPTLLRFATGFLCSTADVLAGYWKPQALGGAKRWRVRMASRAGADSITATLFGAYTQPDTLYAFVSGAVSHGGADNGTTVAGPPVKMGCRNFTATGVQLNQVTDLNCDYYGVPFVRQDHPIRIFCTVTASTATTIQAVGGSCGSVPASFSIYITDVEFGTSAAAGTAADSFPTLKSGTGGTCGAATTVVWQALTGANTTVVSNFTIPRKLTTQHELCWIMTTAGTKTLQIRGWLAP
jgi:hypothetical protein